MRTSFIPTRLTNSLSAGSSAASSGNATQSNSKTAGTNERQGMAGHPRQALVIGNRERRIGVIGERPIGRGVLHVELGRFQQFSLLGEALHDAVERAGSQKRSFDGIRRLPCVNRLLDRPHQVSEVSVGSAF